jgi:hypothetical protein
MGLVNQPPAEDLKNGLNELFFQAGLVAVPGNTLLFNAPKVKQLLKSILRCGAYFLPLRLKRQTIAQPVIREELAIPQRKEWENVLSSSMSDLSVTIMMIFSY